jgi:hypothetical protein
MTKCVNCGGVIPEERLKTFPDTNVCSASCIEAIKYQSFKNQTEAKEENLEKWQQDRDEKIKELFDKRHTHIIAYNNFKSNKISKEDFIKETKKFTWWIKEKIEELGGWLLDNPANYINCPSCKDFTLIHWAKKYKNYFIGCSNFRKGCKWSISIWTYKEWYKEG